MNLIERFGGFELSEPPLAAEAERFVFLEGSGRDSLG